MVKNQINIDIVFEVFTKSIHQRFLIRTVFPKAERMRDVITQGVFSLRRNLNFRVSTDACNLDGASSLPLASCQWTPAIDSVTSTCMYMHLIRLISLQVWSKNVENLHTLLFLDCSWVSASLERYRILSLRIPSYSSRSSLSVVMYHWHKMAQKTARIVAENL